MSKSPCKYHYLRQWLTREGYSQDSEPRDVILECIRSRSGMSMTVYDRGERIFTVNGCGFDRLGTAAAIFLETLFQPELSALAERILTRESQEKHGRALVNPLLERRKDFYGMRFKDEKLPEVSLAGACGLESMQAIAQAIGLRLEQSESKVGALLIFKKAR